MLQVGQKLWWSAFQRYSGPDRYVTVTKVGHKWADLDNRHRIDVQTLQADGKGYTSPGRCYLTQEEYEEACQRSRLFNRLRNDLGYSPRVGVTVDDIRQAARLLKINLEDTP